MLATEKQKKLSLSTPKDSCFKRHSLSKSRKSGKSDLDNFLNASFKNKATNKYHLSTCAEFNPENSMSSPFDKLFVTKTAPAASHQCRKKIMQKKKRQSNPCHHPKQAKKEQIQQILKQDVKLRVNESVQFNQWMQLLREYKQNVPNKENETNIVLRQLEKILELKEDLEIRKYRLISSLI